ncbi:MAG: DUF4258 domain-containing protein [Candidatus Bathyarchaeales archaeon]
MKYTKHAKARAAERGITEDVILEAILQPSQTYYDLSTGTTIDFKKLDEKHLLVAYSREDKEIKIVTTFITSNAQEKLAENWKTEHG